MKLIMENWKRYLKEETSLFGHTIQSSQKVFVSGGKFTKFKTTQQTTGMKPNGLWYSCGDDWIRWLRSEMPHWLDNSNYLYELSTTNKIKHIRTPKEFIEFEKEYADSGPFSFMDRAMHINWKKVQGDGFAGIEICPYQRQFRRDSLWYYPWDVASGCIWDAKGVKDVKLLGERTNETNT